MVLEPGTPVIDEEVKRYNRQSKEFDWGLKIVSSKYDKIKTIGFYALIVLFLVFVSLYGIRTYYHEFYRDVIDISHVCDPLTINNVTVEKQCADVNVDCSCIEESELEDILENVCPNEIEINLNCSV